MSDCATDCQKSCEDHVVKLYYFNVRGRAEFARWIMKYAKVPFEDIRLTKEEWATKKEEGFSPSGQLPLLECTDKKTDKTTKRVQSYTICRVIACWTGLAGKTKCAQAEIDEAVETLRDLMEEMGRAHFEQDEAKKAQMMEKAKKETGPRVFCYLEKKIAANGGKCIAGESLSYADIILACFLDNMAKHRKPDEGNWLEQKFPNVFGVGKAVADTPEIKDWIASRPETPF